MLHARPDLTVSYFQQLYAPICELIYKLLLLYLWLALIQFNGYLSINHFERQVRKIYSYILMYTKVI